MSHLALHSSFCLYFVFHTFFCVICHLLCAFFRPHHTSQPQRGVPNASQLLWPSFKSSRGISLKVQLPSGGYGNLYFFGHDHRPLRDVLHLWFDLFRHAYTSSLATDNRQELKTDDVWEAHCTGTQIDKDRNSSSVLYAV